MRLLVATRVSVLFVSSVQNVRLQIEISVFFEAFVVFRFPCSVGSPDHMHVDVGRVP